MTGNKIIQNKKLVEILIEEKKLLFNEKLQLIRTIKQTITFLGIILSLLFGVAIRFKIGVAYLTIPFVIASVAYYLLTNIHMFNLVIEYIDRIEKAISFAAGAKIPFYETTVAPIMASWGFNITKGFGYFTPNPYILFGFHITMLGIGVYGFSVFEGFRFLFDHIAGTAGIVISYLFLAIGIIIFGVLSFTARQYLIYFKSFTKKILDEAFQEFLSPRDAK